MPAVSMSKTSIHRTGLEVSRQGPGTNNFYFINSDMVKSILKGEKSNSVIRLRCSKTTQIFHNIS